MPESSDQFVIRPTAKRAWGLLLAGLVLVAAAFWAYFRYAPTEWPAWPPLLSFLAFIPALLSYLDTRRTSLTLRHSELRYIRGFWGAGARSVDLRMVRTARAERRLMDRLWNTGTLVIETGSAESRIEMLDIDAPGKWAKRILEAAEAARNSSAPAPDSPNQESL